MKISHKLILGYLLVASLASLTTYFTIKSFQNINSEFDTMVRDPLPTIKALEGIGQGGIRIVSSTTEFGFIHNEAELSNEKPSENQEEELVESGQKLYYESLKSYESILLKTSPDDLDNFEKIKSAGEELLTISREIIEMKKAGVVGEKVLEKKEEFEQKEQNFLQLVEQAKEKEYSQLNEAQQYVESTIEVSTRNTLFVTIFTFLLAIVCGISISRLIARRIIELREASQKVSRGELDTHIESRSNDEVGDLGRTFNKMIADLKDSRFQLLSSKHFVDNIFDSMPDFMMVLNLDGTINRVNKGTLELTGYSEEELLGLPVSNLNGDDELFPAKSLTQLKEKGFINGIERFCRTKNGDLIPISISISLLRNPQGKAIGFVCVAQNISERKRLESKLTHQALHDPLTGLANRLLFHNRVEHALALAVRNKMPLAVMFLDLDNFKNINDSLGHAAGDELLIKVAERIGTCLRTSDTAARLGGDEFALLLEQLNNEEYAVGIAERIIKNFNTPFLIDGKEIFIQTSIGIALSENKSKNPEEILRDADVAMYMAKSLGKGRFEVFEARMHQDLITKLELEADLRRGIDNREFTLVYQPIIEFKTGRITGIEALVRWNHPQRGAVMPIEFIPAAEETGLIIPLGNWILKRACQQARKWLEEFPEKQPLSITVNLSGRQFQHSQIVEIVKKTLAETELPPELLVLELTESMMLQHTEIMIEKLHQLKQLGVRLAIDDFGTGYSSLSYLHRFPIDILKIDRSFINKIETKSEDAAVARAIIMMSDSLHLRTVAEGIESPEQSKLLQNMGCEFGQGFFFAKPLSEKDFNKFLSESNEKDLNVLPFNPSYSGNIDALTI